MLLAEIWNYKTIKHLKIEFEGFASLVGQNFIGKSAVLGAIESCLKNSMDKEAVRRGESYTDVRLVHDKSGLDVYWHYEEGGTYYIINGQTYEKLNGAVPPPLLEKGFGPFTSGDDKVYLWHSPQFQSLFLVDSGRSALTVDLLSYIFNVDAVYKANSLCNKDLKEAKSEHRLRRADLNTERDYLSSLSGFGSVQSGMQGLSALSARTATKASKAAEGEALLGGLLGLQESVRALSGVSLLLPNPSAATLESGIRKLSLLKGHHKALRDLRTTLLALRDVGTMPAPPDGAHSVLKERITRLATGRKLLAEVGALKQGMRKAHTLLSGLPPVGAPESLEAHIRDVLRHRTTLRELNGLQVALRSLSPHVGMPVVAQPSGDLSGRLASARSHLKAIAALGSSLKELGEEEAGLSAEEEKTATALGAYDSCPACGKPLSGAEGHAHA